jgi:signal transduction histidine kinase
MNHTTLTNNGKKVYLFILTIIGFCLFYTHLSGEQNHNWGLTLILISAIVLLNYYMVLVPPKGHYLSMDSAIYLGVIFHFGIHFSLSILLLSSIVSLFFNRTKMALWKQVFNLSMYSIIISGSYYTFILLGGEIGAIQSESAIAYGGALLSYFLINVLCIGIYFSFDSFNRAVSIIKVVLKESVANYIITLALAIIFAILLGTYPFFGTILFTFIIVMLSGVFSKYFHLFEDVVDDKTSREQIMNSLPVGIIKYDNKSEEYTLNSFAEQLLGMSNKQVNDCLSGGKVQDNSSFWTILSSMDMVKNIKVTYKTAGIEHLLLVSQSELKDMFGYSIGRILHWIDITEVEQLEKRMYQSEKLALLGESTARAAHEIRNPLTVIHGFLSLMKQSVPESEQDKYHVPLMINEIERINTILEEMLLVAKPGAPVLKEEVINDIINEILPLYESPSQVNQPIFHIKLDPIPLLLDAKQIKQVLYNLIRNSCDAFDGQCVISIYSKVIENKYQLFVEDRGSGIPTHLQKNIFDPFITSKESGTGLGLTIVQRIIENHNGRIELYSSSPEGTTFLITFPIE